MTDTHRKANSQSRWTFEIFTFVVTGGKDGEDQLKGDEEFYDQGGAHRDTFIHLCE